MEPQLALELSKVSKRYGGRIAVDGVDLVARAGEIHGLVGPNGAGKTTLLRMMLGFVLPDEGTVRVLGRAAGTAPGPATGGMAGFADTPHFYPYLSGRANVRLLARLDGQRVPRRMPLIDQVLEQVGLAPHADAKVAGYSAGMRQRLGWASALLRSPKLLLLDEPTSSLDPAGARDLRAHVRRLASEGSTILLSSHDLAEVEDLCTALTILHRGQVLFSGPIDELKRQVPAAAHRMFSSNDEQALELSRAQPALHVAKASEGGGLTLQGNQEAVDGYVLALARAGVAVRRLEPLGASLEALFLRMTAADAPAGRHGPARAPLSGSDRPPSARGPRPGGVWAAFRVEWEKLSAQLKVWATLAVCLAGPFAFVLAIKVQSNLPDDTLFGRWVKTSGFAVPLLILGFGASWAFPVLSSIVGGDVFSAEDRYGTWPTLLTRSVGRAEIFAGKLLAALTFSALAVSMLAVSSTAAGILGVGRQPLLGLSGTQLPPGQALAWVCAAWASVLPPVLAFTALAALLSLSTRSSAAGVALPALIGFAMEAYAFVDGPYAVRKLLLTPPFVSWHGLFTEPRSLGPLVQGAVTSAVYFALFLAGTYAVSRRRQRGA